MPIINLASKPSEMPASGSMLTAHLEKSEKKSETGLPLFGPFIAYYTYLSHVGVCLEDYERNGYDDSDFYMIVWDAEKQEPKSICFASTRGWSYPCYGSRPDATPEVRAAYEAYKTARTARIRKQARDERAAALRALRLKVSTIAKEAGVSYARLLKLRRRQEFDGMLSLFSPRVRSAFKLSLRAQLIKWLSEETPKFATPFSKKQTQYL